MTSVLVSRSANRVRMRSRSSEARRSPSRLACPRTMSWSPIPGAGPRDEAGFDQASGDIVQLLAGVAPRRLDFRRHLGEGAAANAGAEKIAGLDEGRSRHAGRSRDHAILDRAVLGDQDRQRPAGFQAHELDMLQPRVDLAGQHHAGAAGQFREQARRLGERAFEPASLRRRPHLAVDARPLLAPEIAEFEQRVDEQSQALLRRQAPGAGVRGVDEPELFEILHHIANRRRRKRNRQHARQDAGSRPARRWTDRSRRCCGKFRARVRSASPARSNSAGRSAGADMTQEWPELASCARRRRCRAGIEMRRSDLPNMARKRNAKRGASVGRGVANGRANSHRPARHPRGRARLLRSRRILSRRPRRHERRPDRSDRVPAGSGRGDDGADRGAAHRTAGDLLRHPRPRRDQRRAWRAYRRARFARR